MDSNGLMQLGYIYIIARRIVLGIVFLAAAGLGVTIYELQHRPTYYDTDHYQNHRYDAKMLDGMWA